MKAMHKQLWGYLLITLSLAGFTPLQAQTDSVDEGGYITVSGIVKDKKSKKSLEYVNISIPGSTTGTVTNADGEFSFKVKDSIHAKEVEISHLGYFNSKIELNGKDVEEQTVWLTPYTNMLDEVIIHARDPRYLVEEAIKKIPANYSSKHSLLTGFYRETAQKGRRYINISEAVIDIYKTSYDEGVDRDRVQIFKGRKLLSQKASDTLAVKLLVGFLMFGNLLRECGVLNALSETAQNVLANLITIVLGLTVAGQMTADKFVRPDTLLILALGLVAFIFDTAGGVFFAKLLNLFLPEGKKINPMIGAAGISAFPMSGRVVNQMGLAEDNQNFLLMYSISVNVSGQIASVIAGGLILTLMSSCV